MTGIFDVQQASGSSLFTASSTQRSQMEGIAKRILSNALEYFVDKKYDEAITQFQRAIGLAPLSGTATDAYDYMARAYQQKGDVNAAITAYEESLRGDPTNPATYVSLGNIYTTQEEHVKARDAYLKAVKLDDSAANRYSLGQAYIALEEYDDAATQFNIVKEKTPTKPNGDYGLGLTYAKQGLTDDAIASFERAISIQNDFWEAHVELGYALTDRGDADMAEDIVRELESAAVAGSDTLASSTTGLTSDANIKALADLLSNYIYEQTPAKLDALLASSTFPRKLGARTEVSDLSAYLTDANSQKTFTMVFQFSKPMDRSSVEDVYNWNISRSIETGRGDGYNFSQPLPATEIKLAPTPTGVFYDQDSLTATVMFTVRQNDTANGTIDPSHIKFKFSGEDAKGLSMDTTADEYVGLTGFA